MNKKLFLAVLTILVCASLIAAGTMSWFTDEADTGETVFQAGTVKISAGESSVLGGKRLDNVNPGDCYVLKWKVSNDGTKKIQLRAQLNYGWTNGALSGDNVYIIPAPVNRELGYEYNWVLHQEAADKPLYAYLNNYPDGIQPGDEIELWLIVYFDGEMTDNPYQAQEFTLDGKFEAVQATNGAPSAVWGNSWEVINNNNYSFTYEYWHENWQTFNPMNIKCYKNLVREEGNNPNNPGNEDPGQSAPKAASFQIVLNETHVNNGTATVKFQIHNLRDEMNNKIDGKKNVDYQIYINGSIVYEGRLVDAEFKSGNLNNNIIADVPGENKDMWKVIAVIDGITVDSGEKKLN